jgi:hypothetical protein
MGYLVEGLELFIHKVAYTKYDATVLVRWSNYTRMGVDIETYRARIGGSVIGNKLESGMLKKRQESCSAEV